MTSRCKINSHLPHTFLRESLLSAMLNYTHTRTHTRTIELEAGLLDTRKVHSPVHFTVLRFGLGHVLLSFINLTELLGTRREQKECSERKEVERGECKGLI